MKNPLPRPLPVSIDATAGSEALTTSSIEPVATLAGLLDADGADSVSAMLPLTGATNVPGVCATPCSAADSLASLDSGEAVRVCAAIGAGAFVCTM